MKPDGGRGRYRRFWIAATAALGALAIIVFALALAFGTRITRANFAKIRIGMSRPEVETLLGRSADFRSPMIGQVTDPSTFTTNDDPEARRGRDFREYRFHQWDSPDIHVMVICDRGDRVVCRYST